MATAAMQPGYTGSLPAGFVPSPTMVPVAAPSSDGGEQVHTGGAGAMSAGKDTPHKDDSALLTLPLARVKKMAKDEEDVKAISADAAFAIARATELFLEEVAGRAAAHVPAGSKKGLTYNEVAQAVAQYKSANDFLGDIVPLKVTAAELLQRMQQPQQKQNGV